MEGVILDVEIYMTCGCMRWINDKKHYNLSNFAMLVIISVDDDNDNVQDDDAVILIVAVVNLDYNHINVLLIVAVVKLLSRALTCSVHLSSL